MGSVHYRQQGLALVEAVDPLLQGLALVLPDLHEQHRVFHRTFCTDKVR